MPSCSGRVELVERHLRDLEVLVDRVAKGRLGPGVAEVGQQAVIPEHGQPGVGERDERHQRVTVRAVAADRVGVCARRLVAVMAVGDQQLRLGQFGGHRAVGLGVVDPPDAVGRALVVGHLAPRLAAGVALDVAPGIALVQREDRRHVVAGRLGEAEAVLLRPRLGALVWAHEPRAVGRHPDSAEEAAPDGASAVGGVVLLSQGPERRLAVGAEDALQPPLLERLGGVLVRIAAPGRARQVDLDHVEWRTGEQLRPLRRVDHVVRRSDHVGQCRDRGEVVVQRVERADLGHRARNPSGRPRTPPWCARTRSRAAISRQSWQHAIEAQDHLAAEARRGEELVQPLEAIAARVEIGARLVSRIARETRRRPPRPRAVGPRRRRGRRAARCRASSSASASRRPRFVASRSPRTGP